MKLTSEEGFPEPRWPVEQNDESSSLASYDILKAHLASLEMSSDQGLNEAFLMFIHHQMSD